MRRLVLLAVVLGLGSLLVAGFLGRHYLLERWYLANLESEDPASRLTAITRLAEIRSSRAVPLLAERLRRVGTKEKIAILEALRAMGPVSAEAAPALVELLDEDLGWQSAYHALDAIGPAALPVILDPDLHGGRHNSRWRILFFTHTSTWSARYLVEQAGAECPRRRALSLEILRAMGHRVLPQLACLWASVDPEIQRWVANAAWISVMEGLRTIDAPPTGLSRFIDPALQGAELSRAAVSLAAEMIELDEATEEILSGLWLGRDFSDVRAHAIRAVAQSPGTARPWIPHLCSWLADEVALRTAAFDALSDLGTARFPADGSAGGPVVSALLGAFESGEDKGKRWAQVLLVEIGLRTSGTVAAIEEALPGAGPLARPWIEKVLLRVRSAGGK